MKSEIMYEIASGINVALDEVYRQSKNISDDDNVTVEKIKSLLETARAIAVDAAKKRNLKI